VVANTAPVSLASTWVKGTIVTGQKFASVLTKHVVTGSHILSQADLLSCESFFFQMRNSITCLLLSSGHSVRVTGQDPLSTPTQVRNFAWRPFVLHVVEIHRTGDQMHDGLEATRGEHCRLTSRSCRSFCSLFVSTPTIKFTKVRCVNVQVLVLLHLSILP
jgi:hypothetical protein